MPISPEDRAELIQLATAAVRAQVTRGVPPEVDEPAGLLAEKRGCFVTLTNRGRLRGCIGTFQPRTVLARTICEMGRAAAADPRFVTNPVTPEEMSELTVEVSVLSPLTETSEPQRLEIGKHGIYVVRGFQSGCFLPEVATDMSWSVEEFLDQCCVHKAGLPRGAWRDPGTKVYLFTSEKFDR